MICIILVLLVYSRSDVYHVRKKKAHFWVYEWHTRWNLRMERKIRVSKQNGAFQHYLTYTYPHPHTRTNHSRSYHFYSFWKYLNYYIVWWIKYRDLTYQNIELIFCNSTYLQSLPFPLPRTSIDKEMQHDVYINRSNWRKIIGLIWMRKKWILKRIMKYYFLHFSQSLKIDWYEMQHCLTIQYNSNEEKPLSKWNHLQRTK
jgi:hypothetical protein